MVTIQRAVLVISVLLAAAASAAANDAVLAGYQQFYAGDREGARRHFEQLLTKRPSDLSARLGLLQVIENLSRGNRPLEAEFERLIDPFLADAEARYGRSSTDDEALFSLANGYLLRARYRFDHSKGMWGAARDAARSKRYAESYIKRRPEHGDAYFALGAYNYYVDIAPAFMRVMRAFLFLPGGNRVDGLRQIERAYREGSLFRLPAGMVLMEVYSSFEGRPSDGVTIGQQLARAHPDNPSVHFELAQLYLSPAVEDYDAAAAQYEATVTREDRRADEREARYQARLGLASARVQQWRIDDAIRLLSATIDAKPEKFLWVMPNFLLRRANYRALLNDQAAADDTRRVLGDPRWKDWHKQANDQLAWMERRRASREAAVYAALIPANRATVEGKWPAASTMYDRVLQQYPNDPQVRYRVGRLHFARGDLARASAELSAVAENRSTPPWLRAQALLYVGRAHDISGRRADARRVYERIVDDHERESVVWAAKVGLVTPYKRR